MTTVNARVKTIACIVGARPNFMKIAPIMEELCRRPGLKGRLIHTGQHFSAEMSAAFFHDLAIPEPDENLGVAAGTQTQQTASMMLSLEESFLATRPDLVLVVGDVTSTLAATLVASKLEIPVAHVEAGLRSFDRHMPEEINRLVTDTLADYLFVSEPSGVTNLRAEGVPEEKIFFVGNVMIDTLMKFRDRAMQSGILQQYGLEPKSYALATLHRPSNVDHPEQLRSLADVLTKLSVHLPVIFPVHPRTRQRLTELNLPESRLILTTPLGYLDFLRLMTDARMVLTDSGGIQEETTILKVPCLTLRNNTERPVTITSGINRLVSTDPAVAFHAAMEVLAAEEQTATTPELWDGHASVRIIDTIAKLFS